MENSSRMRFWAVRKETRRSSMQENKVLINAIGLLFNGDFITIVVGRTLDFDKLL